MPRTIVEPGGFDEILLGQMNPGTYPFVCTIHDGMVGTLTVLDRAGDLGPTDPSEGRVTHRSRKATGR